MTLVERIDVNGWACSFHEDGLELRDMQAAIMQIADVALLGQPRLLIAYTKENAPKGSMSSHIGLSAQPYHTDCATWPSPPRFMSLTCVEDGEFPTATRILEIDHHQLIADRPAAIFEDIWAFQANGFVASYNSIYHATLDQNYRLKFDPLVMRSPNNNIGSALDMLISFGRKREVFLRKGEWLVIDNWRCLHARAKVLSGSQRKILRQYWG